MEYFEVRKRNPHHWDIYNNKRRLFCIRGESGRIILYGDNDYKDRPQMIFPSVISCMSFICVEFMSE